MAESQSSRLEHIPAELLLTICKKLPYESLAHLSRANKFFNNVAHPLLWDSVELHRDQYHEQCQFPDEWNEANWKHREAIRVREYFNISEGWDFDRATTFLKLFEPQAAVSAARLDELASTVTLLCLNHHRRYSGTDKEPWGVFSRFRNLEYLDVTGHYTGEPEEIQLYQSKIDAGMIPGLNKLETLHLTGYHPAEFVRWACRGNVAGLTDLTLALLDRPIASDADEYNPPRALSALLNSDLIPQFTSLTHLTLRRPAKTSLRRDESTDRQSVNLILQEWQQLIAQARPTLEHLILDQRPHIYEVDHNTGYGQVEFLIRGSHGPGYRAFKSAVLPELVAEAVDWPKLKSIRVYGFDVPQDLDLDTIAIWQEHQPIDKGDPEDTVLRALEKRFGGQGIHIFSGLGRQMVYTMKGELWYRNKDGFGGLEPGYSYSSDEEEDEEEEEDDGEDDDGEGDKEEGE